MAEKAHVNKSEQRAIREAVQQFGRRSRMKELETRDDVKRAIYLRSRGAAYRDIEKELKRGTGNGTWALRQVRSFAIKEIEG